jgi:hypothetical protein
LLLLFFFLIILFFISLSLSLPLSPTLCFSAFSCPYNFFRRKSLSPSTFFTSGLPVHGDYFYGFNSLQTALPGDLRRRVRHKQGTLPVIERFFELVLGLGRRRRRHVQQDKISQLVHLTVSADDSEVHDADAQKGQAESEQVRGRSDRNLSVSEVFRSGTTCSNRDRSGSTKTDSTASSTR